MFVKTVLQRFCKRGMPAAAFLLLLLILGVGDARAATVEADGFTVSYGYKYGDDYVVTRYTGRKADVELPATVVTDDGVRAVTMIGETAFQGNTAITSVTVPENYKTIESNAFEGCTGLTSVSLPGSLETVQGWAFKNCSALERVEFAENPDGDLRLMTSAFENCASLERVTLPAQLTGITNDANVFLGASRLREIAVSPDCQHFFADGGVLYAKNEDGTATLVTYPQTPAVLEIPEKAGGLTVTGIGAHTFRGNTALREVRVPAGVTSFGLQAFKDCTGLMKLTLGCETAPELGSGVFLNLGEGSVIYVASQAVADALAPVEEYGGITEQYSGDRTRVEIAAALPEGRFDVNGDQRVDLMDLTEAQRYYQAKAGDGNWTAAQAGDVTGDGQVDVKDYEALFQALAKDLEGRPA